jgi:cell division protein FtsL
MHTGEAIHQTIPAATREISPLKYSPYLLVVFVLMAVAIIYVWSHLKMTQLEYKVAEEMDRTAQLLDEQRKLRLEVATLKSPSRIEPFVKEQLQMSYPEANQVITVNWPEGR